MSTGGLNTGPSITNVNTIGGDYSSILSDGNTVAWWDYDEADTILKDSSDYVIGWANKLGYSEGAEMIDQANWYKMSYWSAYGANWTQVGSTLSSDGTTGTCNKNNFWVVGRTYKVTITVTCTSGTLRPANCNGGFPPIAAPITIAYYMVCTNTTLYNYSASFNGTITALSIKEVSTNALTLLQYTAGQLPVWSVNGLLFDGTNDYMKALAFTWNQPEMIYMVVKQVTWTLNDKIFDGHASTSGVLYQTANTPELKASADTLSAANNNLATNTWGIIRVLFNSADSKIIVNDTTPTTWNCGASNMSGFTLGAIGAGNAGFGNIQVKEIILRNVVDATGDETIIYNYLKNKYGL